MHAFFFNNRFNICFAVVLFACALCEEDDWERKELMDLIPELYLKYREAVCDAKTVSFRRILSNNKEYNIHVNKLKDVNGLKRHNLIIKEKSEDNPFIYINNPVEMKIPNAYISLEEFKRELTGRILRQRAEFTRQYQTISYATLQLITSEFKKKPFTAKHRVKTVLLTKPVNKTKSVALVTNFFTKIALKMLSKQLPTKTMHTKETVESTSFKNTLSDATTVNNTTTSESIQIEKTESITNDTVPNKVTEKTILRSKELLIGTTNINNFAEMINPINVTHNYKDTTLENNQFSTQESQTILKESNSHTSEENLLILITEEQMTTPEITTEELGSLTSTTESDNTMIEDTTLEEMTTQNTPNTLYENQMTTNEIARQSTNTEADTDESSTDELITMKSTTKIKRITLGRPLVFFGGYRH